MSAPRITIVGAGAMGVVTAHHLRHAGADVTFLVRPERARSVPERYRLYSYDDARVHELAGHHVRTDPTAVAADLVLLTLDGAGLASAAGRTLLEGLGVALRRSEAPLVVGSLGAAARTIAVRASGLPDERVVGGSLAMLSHASDAGLPAHPPTDVAALARTHFAFRHLNEGGFRLEDRTPAITAWFTALYDRSGIARCFSAPPADFARMTRDIFPVFLAAELAGWPDADGLVAHPELWPLAVAGVRAIAGLAEHGEGGRKAAAELTADGLAALWRGLEAAARPLDFAAFNAYHHGRKIRAADVLLLEELTAQGVREGRDMGAVRELLDRAARAAGRG